jgi:CRISPR/Cas system-associated exonuclease Cas4 (RecB family)
MIKWSFSGLKDFINCPKQYHEVKVLQNFTKRVTEQMQYGTEVHKALEDYARDGKPLAKNYERFREMVNPLLEIPGKKYIEHKMALRIDYTPCSFDAPDYWVRGIADFMVVNGDTAYVVDYKTGSAKYPDAKQLKLMALMIFQIFPEVDKVNGGLLFILNNAFINEEYLRTSAYKYWGSFRPDLARLEMAYESNTWPANPTGLCGWCPVKSCEFNKR